LKTEHSARETTINSTWPEKITIKSLALLFSGKAAQEGYLAAVDQGVISLSNFLATILLARSASPTELGVYGVGFTALRLARSLQEGITIQPMNVIGAGMDEEEFRRYATGTSLLQIALAIICSMFVAAGGWILTATGNDVAGPTVFALWFVFLWWQLQEYIRRMMYTRGTVFNAVVNTILANIVRLALMVWWMQRGNLNGITSLDAIGWGSLAALVPGLWFTRRFWGRSWLSLRQTWQRNWDFGRWVLGGTLANWVAVEFYPVLTAGMISFAAAGAYRALQNLVAPIHLLLRAIDTFLTPRAARQFDQGGKIALVRTLRLTYMISGIPILSVLGIAMLFPAQILHLLYGDTYVGYAGGVTLMAIFYILWFAYWPMQTALKAARFSRPIFNANLAAIVTMFTIGVWAIQRWGVFGTIAGQALNSLVVAVILWAAWFKIKRKES
jgi:O-antigen/teichoic acid export membrane protein